MDMNMKGKRVRNIKRYGPKCIRKKERKKDIRKI